MNLKHSLKQPIFLELGYQTFEDAINLQTSFTILCFSLLLRHQQLSLIEKLDAHIHVHAGSVYVFVMQTH